MKTLNILVTLFIISSLTSGSLQAEMKAIKLTSLDWPPYTQESLPFQGASAAVVKEAFKVMGYEAKVDFYPWSRAIDSAKKDPTYIGYFPEYYSKEVANDFILSEPIGAGPLGFAELVESPVNWKSLDDLAKISIGVVQDYVNTEEFDQMVASNRLKVETAVSDKINLVKLANKRIQLVVIDKNVMNDLIKNTPELKSFKDKIRFNAKILEDKKLYICFKKSAEGRQIAKICNEGLKKIDINAIMAKYFH